MKTFDYITAWHTAAKPAYEALPQNVRDLLDRTARVTAGLHQLSDCSMPWPTTDDDPQATDVSGVQGFRQAFREIPAETLALAARAIYDVGHWYPAKLAGGYVVPGRDHGATWKFAHYADQDLRERLGLPARGDGGRTLRGYGYQVHEGAIRVTYESRDEWTWQEIAPATAKGLAHAQQITAECGAKGVPPTFTDDMGEWPEDWQPFKAVNYMVDSEQFTAREAARPEAVTKTRADLVARFEQKGKQDAIELAGMLWLLDQGLPIDNVIYYHHTDRFCFGWREPVSPASQSKILEVISEFPHAYDIKTADGRTLSGD